MSRIPGKELKGFFEYADISDQTKITFLAILQNFKQGGFAYINFAELARIRAKPRSLMYQHIKDLTSEGFLCQTSSPGEYQINTQRLKEQNEGVLPQPVVEIQRPQPQSLSFQGKNPRSRKDYRQVPIRQWNADCFVDYFRDKYEEINGWPSSESESIIKRGIITNGINQVARLDKTSIPPTVRFKQFIDFVLAKFARPTSGSLKSQKVIMMFLNERPAVNVLDAVFDQKFDESEPASNVVIEVSDVVSTRDA